MHYIVIPNLSKPTSVSVTAEELATSLGIQTLNDLEALSDTLLWLNLPLELRLNCLELLQHEIFAFCHLRRFLSCDDVSVVQCHSKAEGHLPSHVSTHPGLKANTLMPLGASSTAYFAT